MYGQESVWIDQARAGNGYAFSHLVDSYRLPVYKLAYRILGREMDAEDATQEAFIRAYYKLDTYHPSRSFRSWLFAITAHLCIDQLRRESRVEAKTAQLYTTSVSPWAPDSDLMKREGIAEIQVWISQLPLHYRKLTFLHYWEGMTYQQISERVGLSVGTVKTRLYRARRQLARLAKVTEAHPVNGI